jgi:hypothetical protein
MMPSPDPVKPNRVGLRSGQVSELTAIVPLQAGGADKLRQILAAAGAGLPAAGYVGTLHDMRFVILDNDTKLLFATAYDGDWDSYITDFATKIPDAMNTFFSMVDGWPGIKNDKVRDFIADHQIPATAWFVAYPDETVASIKRAVELRDALTKIQDAVSSGNASVRAAVLQLFDATKNETGPVRDALDLLGDALAEGH